MIDSSFIVMASRLAFFLLICAAFSPGSPTLAGPWQRHVIDPADPANHRSGADGVRLGDLNGDGRPDLVTGWEEGDQIRVYLQPVASGIRNLWQAITVGRVPSPEDAVFADLDGDGRPDVVSATEGNGRTVFVHWAPTPPADIADESAWKTAPFPVTAGKQWWMYSLPLDVDRDGDLDLIVGSKNAAASVTWLKNPGHPDARNLSRWEATRLTGAGWIMSLEVMETSSGRFLIYSDRKGTKSGIYLVPIQKKSPWFGKPVLVGAAGEEVMFLDLADFGGDGRPDIIAAIRPQALRVFLHPETPDGYWTNMMLPPPVPSDRFGTVKAVKCADIDADGKPEFVATCENATGEKEGVFLADIHANFTSVSGPEGIKFDRIELLDLDSDGDLDIITCEERAGLGIVWYENPHR